MAALIQPKRSRIIELYVPEYEIGFDHFMITPSMTYKDIVMSVRATFRNTHELGKFHLCDINGEPLFEDENNPSSVSAIANGERILIAIDDERIPPEPRLEVELFLEDETLTKPLRVCLSLSLLTIQDQANMHLTETLPRKPPQPPPHPAPWRCCPSPQHPPPHPPLLRRPGRALGA
jgi:hypothetical protein